MTQHQQSNHLLVVDVAIEAPEPLIQGAVSQAQVLKLTGERHPLCEISDYLEQHQTIDAVHLLAHGKPGAIQLGQTWLTQQNLDRWGHQLRQWSQFLRPQASVILYGCRTAAGALGQEFLNHLHQLLGVTVAASTQVVGQGNWQFDRILRPESSRESAKDAATVPYQIPLPFHRNTLASYPGTFDIPNFLYATDDAGESTPSRLYIINPDTGDLETFNGGTFRQLSARTFALSRDADGKLFYTGPERIGTDDRVSVYRFDPDTGEDRKIGFFRPTTIEDATGRPILRLGQDRDGRIYAMTNQNQVIYRLDVSATGEFAENYEIPLTEITIPNQAGIRGQGGGDLAFDPQNPNVLFVSSRGPGTNNEYRIYRLTLTNDAVTNVQLAGIAVDNNGNNLGGGGSLAFGADQNIYFNAGTVMYRLTRQQLNTGGTLTAQKIEDFTDRVRGGNLSDFASLPQEIAALVVSVEKESDGENLVPGDEIVYTITIENKGSNRIPNVIVSDPIPDGIASFSWRRTIGGSTSTGTGAIADDNFPLDAGQTAVYRITATIQSSSNLNSETIVNEASVRAPGFAFLEEPNNPNSRRVNTLFGSDRITLANTPPEVQDDLVTTPPGETTPITGILGTDPNGIREYIIETLPSGGTLRLNGQEVTPGQVIPANQIQNLSFTANNNFNGSSFTYTAVDNLGLPSDNRGTITLNSPPTATGGSETVPPGSATNLSDSLLSASDPDGNVDFFKITELPPTSQGRLFIGDPDRGGREVRPDERLTPEQLDQLFFKAEPGFTGTTFKFIAIDNDGGRSRPAEVSLDVGNSPPDTNNVLQVIEPGTPVTLEGLGGTDLEDNDDDLRFEIVELPGQGTLTLDGRNVTRGQRLTAEELSRLQFQFPEGFSGNTSFKYAAIDTEGLKDPTPGTVFLKTEGSNIPPETNEVTQNVPPNTFGGANQIPAGIATRLTGLGGDDPDGEVQEFRITQAPRNGTLFLGDPGDGGRALGTGDRIPKNRINDVFFLPGNNFNGTDFRYAAIDNDGKEDPTPRPRYPKRGQSFPGHQQCHQSLARPRRYYSSLGTRRE